MNISPKLQSSYSFLMISSVWKSGSNTGLLFSTSFTPRKKTLVYSLGANSPSPPQLKNFSFYTLRDQKFNFFSQNNLSSPRVTFWRFTRFFAYWGGGGMSSLINWNFNDKHIISKFSQQTFYLLWLPNNTSVII